MKEYTVSGPTGEYTVLLSDEDAKKMGAKPVEAKASKPANKAAAPDNKAAEPKSKRAEAASQAFGKG